MHARRLAAFLLMLAAAPAATAAQLVPIRTVPLETAHQFRIFPSATAAAGDASIARTDSLYDAFENPASPPARSYFFTSPGTFGPGDGPGGGRTLPIGVLTGGDRWFGGLALAIQGVDQGERPGSFFLQFEPCPACGAEELNLDTNPGPRSNEYAFVLAGRRFPERGLVVGASVHGANLRALDGLDLLFPTVARVEQRGDVVDVRLGLKKEWEEGRALEALALHHRESTIFDLLHMVQFWDPGERRFHRRPSEGRTLHRLRTWGARLTYRTPLTEGWRAGWSVTAERSFRGAVPDFEIARVPPAPARSTALELGVGATRRWESAMVSLDVAFQPIHGRLPAAESDPPPPGRYRFANGLLRVGMSDRVALDAMDAALGLRLGLEARTIGYRFSGGSAEHSWIPRSDRWAEWTPTWGAAFDRPGWELRYDGSAVHGTARAVRRTDFPDFGIGVLPADGTIADPSGGPVELWGSGPPALRSVRVVTHRLTLSFRLH